MELSIITINLNNQHGLKKTIDSIISQTYKEFEYIVIDGDSNDGSKELLNEYSSAISFWISEKDNGIYNAMNKGIRLSHGDYILFLNSGDYLCENNTILNIIPLFDETSIIQGNIITISNGVKNRDRGYGKSDINLYDIYRGHFLHQASFFSRKVFDQCGLFDEKFHIAGDTAFYAKCLAFHDLSFKYIDYDIAVFDTTGISSKQNKTFEKLQQDEYILYLKSSFPPRILEYIESNAKKIKFYDDLFSHKLLWCLARVLHRISILPKRN